MEVLFDEDTMWCNVWALIGAAWVILTRYNLDNGFVCPAHGVIEQLLGIMMSHDVT